jgi:hypothetical protein
MTVDFNKIDEIFKTMQPKPEMVEKSTKELQKVIRLAVAKAAQSESRQDTIDISNRLSALMLCMEKSCDQLKKSEETPEEITLKVEKELFSCLEKDIEGVEAKNSWADDLKTIQEKISKEDEEENEDDPSLTKGEDGDGDANDAVEKDDKEIWGNNIDINKNRDDSKEISFDD